MKTLTLGLGLLSFALAATLPTSTPAHAQDGAAMSAAGEKLPFLHPLFSDNAVLQRDRAIAVWGWTKPGTSVVVKLDNATQTVRSAADGKWTATIGPMAAGGPHTLSVAGSQPGEIARRSNILFGDVWICSGQSNMQWGLGSSMNGAEEIAQANYPNIRLLTVPNVTSPTPKSLANIGWQVCSPQTAGGFSAVGYFFGREINKRTGVPIGLINSSWGGTIAEAWVSAPALNRDVPEFKPQIDSLLAPDADVPYAQKMADWWAKNDMGQAQGFANADFADANWKAATVPGGWETSGDAEMAQFDGIVWYRRVVDVPAAMAGKDLTLHLGTVDDQDATYWNGELIGHGDAYNASRDYTIPAAKVKAGRNVLAVRVLDTGGGGGIIGPGETLRLEAGLGNSLPLGGAWKMQRGKALADLTPVPQNQANNPNVPTVLYNAMIAPLVPYGIKGALWYQGESNAGRGEQYKKLLPSLIRDWRSRFNSGEFPFYIVQLAGFMAPDDQPKNDAWPQLRDAQNFTAETVGHSGVALAIDIGDEKDIHPTNKQDVGLRLALNALAKDYGQNVVYQGPVFQSATRQGETMVLKFTNTGGELSLKGDSARVFAIAGDDKNFAWATPRIVGDTIVLSSPAVKMPTAVRYGWSNLPRATLYNKAGLPANQFRTDTW